MFLLFFWLQFQSPPTGAKIVLGQQRAAYKIEASKAGFQPVGYRNNGFHQKVDFRNGTIYLMVTTHNKPLTTKALAKPCKPLPPQLKSLEQRLNAVVGQPLPFQIALLFDWLKVHIQAEHHFDSEQSLNKVLETRQANCVGLATLSLYLLEKVGVDARYVTGIAFQPKDPARLKLQGAVLHRWIEIHYPDIGWVFADPAGKVNHVEARYLILGVQGIHPLSQSVRALQGGYVELLAFQNGLQIVARQEGIETSLRIRPNRLFLQP